ncbi:MAG: transposase [Polyangiaceae bacterium]
MRHGLPVRPDHRCSGQTAPGRAPRGLVLEPLDLCARIAALIPPRFHMVRYHGVLSSHAKLRPEVVPPAAQAEQQAVQLRAIELQRSRDSHSWRTSASRPAPSD